MVPFAEVIPALEKGVVDCGITGTMSAYKAKWHQVATHAYTLRVGWGLAFGAMNMDKWNSLSDEQKAVLTTEIAALNDRMWAETATEDEVAISCITGGACDIGEPGNEIGRTVGRRFEGPRSGGQRSTAAAHRARGNLTSRSSGPGSMRRWGTFHAWRDGWLRPTARARRLAPNERRRRPRSSLRGSCTRRPPGTADR